MVWRIFVFSVFENQKCAKNCEYAFLNVYKIPMKNRSRRQGGGGGVPSIEGERGRSIRGLGGSSGDSIIADTDSRFFMRKKHDDRQATMNLRIQDCKLERTKQDQLKNRFSVRVPK